MTLRERHRHAVWSQSCGNLAWSSEEPPGIPTGSGGVFDWTEHMQVTVTQPWFLRSGAAAADKPALRITVPLTFSCAPIIRAGRAPSYLSERVVQARFKYHGQNGVYYTSSVAPYDLSGVVTYPGQLPRNGDPVTQDAILDVPHVAFSAIPAVMLSIETYFSVTTHGLGGWLATVSLDRNREITMEALPV